MKRLQEHSWVLLFLVGLFFLYYAYDNLIVIPALPCDDPERSWEWLTCEPEIIDYIKFWFRMLGVWAAAVAVSTLLIAATGYRRGQRWAWWAMWVPVAVLLAQAYFIPFFAWLYGLFIVLALLGLLLPYRRFFPKN